MQSPDNGQQSFESPVSVNGSLKSTSSDEVGLISSPIITLSPAPSNLEEVILESDYVDVNTRKDRVSIDSEASTKSESSGSEGLEFSIHIEQEERLDEIHSSAPPSVILDAESNSEITSQIIGCMSKANSDLERELEAREIKARQDALAILELQEQCRILNLQLQTLHQQREAEARESARISEQRRAAIARQRALQDQVERTGY